MSNQFFEWSYNPSKKRRIPANQVAPFFFAHLFKVETNDDICVTMPHMSLHGTSLYRITYTFICTALLVVSLTGCKKTKSQYYSVRPNTVDHFNDTQLHICGDSIQPIVRRNVGCGTSADNFKSDFTVEIRKAFHRVDPTWESLPNAYWNWESECLIVPMTKDYIANHLIRGLYSMQVHAPDGNVYFKQYAFGIKTPWWDGTIKVPPPPGWNETDSSTGDTDTDNETDTPTTSLTDTDSYVIDSDSIVYDTESDTESPLARTTIAWEPIGTVVIDGALNDWPTSNGARFPNRLSRIILKKADSGEGSATVPICSFEQMWDQQFLYIAIRCEDKPTQAATADALSRGDSVEIYLDVSDLQSAGNDSVPTQLSIGFSGDALSPILRRSVPSLKNIRIAQRATGATTTGFTIETAIPWSSLNIPSPAPNSEIGYDIGVNDWDTGTTRDFKLMWSGTTNNYISSADFGRLRLMPEPAPELSAIEDGKVFVDHKDASTNSCEQPRSVLWQLDPHYKHPIKAVLWSYYLNVINENCTPNADADVWFSVNVPAYKTVYIEPFNNREFDIAFWQKTSEGCDTMVCNEMAQNNDGVYFITNDADNELTATVVVSTGNIKDDDLTYFTFEVGDAADQP